jgi:hypothetical protein
MSLTRWVLLAVSFALLGCSGRRVPVPSISGDKAAEEALAQYDRNKDSSLDAEELKLCPALASGLKSLDKDKNGRLSAIEIAERIKSYESSQVGLTALIVKATLDGKPLAGATVTLTPEKFLGDAVKPASATTDTRGMATPTAAGAVALGVACGMYRVEVSKKDTAGKELLPPRYNQLTTLGVEIGPDHQGVLRLKLRSS